MRKTNVFGKKINQFKPLYFIAIIFALLLAAFFGVTYYQNTRIAELKEEESCTFVNDVKPESRIKKKIAARGVAVVELEYEVEEHTWEYCSNV